MKDCGTISRGLPTYAGNSLGTALITIVLCLGLTVPAGYGLARYPVPFKEPIFVLLLLALIIPYQALLTPLFFMFVQINLHNSLLGLAILHTSIQLPFSLYVMRNAFETVPKELEEAANRRWLQQFPDTSARIPSGNRPSDHHRFAVRLHHLVERVPWRAGDA